MNRLFNCSIASLLFNAVAVTSMKHHFRIRKANAIFGPLGEPFAFNKNGNYNMDLKDFKMYRKVGANSSAVIKNLDDYVGGFYLQKFDNEAEFYRYMETLKSDDNNDSSNNNGTRIQCSYQYFLDKDDPFDTINDDFDGSTIPQSSAKHGVLLIAYSSKKTINSVNYTFKE